MADAFLMLLVVGFLWVSGETVLSLLAPIVFAVAVWVFAGEGGAISRALTASVTTVAAITNRSAKSVAASLTAAGAIVRQSTDRKSVV